MTMSAPSVASDRKASTSHAEGCFFGWGGEGGAPASNGGKRRRRARVPPPPGEGANPPLALGCLTKGAHQGAGGEEAEGVGQQPAGDGGVVHTPAKGTTVCGGGGWGSTFWCGGRRMPGMVWKRRESLRRCVTVCLPPQ